MTTRYQNEHYEDVARILQQYTSARSEPDHLMPAERSASIATGRAAALDFADLFAADSPPCCRHCRSSESDAAPLCLGRDFQNEHNFEGGFDREQFLAACGLESEAAQ